MKPKMRDNLSNRFAIYHMIGQCEDLNIEVSTQLIAGFMGVSKGTALKRLEKWVKEGHVIVHVNVWRGKAKRYTYNLGEYTNVAYQNGAYLRFYVSWAAMSSHVRDVRVGSQRAMFV